MKRYDIDVVPVSQEEIERQTASFEEQLDDNFTPNCYFPVSINYYRNRAREQFKNYLEFIKDTTGMPYAKFKEKYMKNNKFYTLSKTFPQGKMTSLVYKLTGVSICVMNNRGEQIVMPNYELTIYYPDKTTNLMGIEHAIEMSKSIKLGKEKLTYIGFRYATNNQP